MPLVARARSRDRVVPGAGNLMDRLLAAGFPVASSCSGRGACGRCVVEVLEGREALTPTKPREIRTLERNGLEPPLRLACQCSVRHARDWVTVRASYW